MVMTINGGAASGGNNGVGIVGGDHGGDEGDDGNGDGAGADTETTDTKLARKQWERTYEKP
jgi:hypothetical protein